MRPIRSVVLASVAPLALLLALASCGGGTKTPTSPTTPGNNTGGGGSGNPPGGGGTTGGGGFPTSAAVSVSDNQFAPATVIIARTGTVTWTWSGAGYGVPHNVTFTADGTSSEDKTDGTYAKTFATTGVFTYRCTNHPTQMTGTVDVR